MKRRITSFVSHRRVRFAAIFCTIIALVAFAGTVSVSSADDLAGPVQAPAAQATAANPAAPTPVGSVVVPSSISTGQVPGPVDTSGPSTSSNPNSVTDTAPGTPAAAANTGFPWLIGLIIAVMLILIVIAFAMVRARRASLAAGLAPTSGPISTGPTAATTTTTTTTTATAAPSTPQSSAARTGVAAPVAATAGAAVPASTEAAPSTLTCPNCGTVNGWNENFCHECGQDLRPVRAAMVAAAAPPEIATDDMPYLETLDRTDEQLEYVLSRNRVVIGTAAGSDIVIDSSFRGHETVSPRHAELRREAEGFFLTDLNSENGTFVNDQRTGEQILAEGDVIKLGSVRFVYRVP